MQHTPVMHGTLPRFLRPRLFWLLPILAACGGGGGSSGPVGPGPGPGGGGPPGPLPGGAIAATHAGLIAAAAGDGVIRVEWNLPTAAGHQAALFHSTSSATVYSGAPALSNVTGSGAQINGANGVTRHLGLGIRQGSSGTWQPVGEILRATPGVPIYVDAAATSAGNGSLATPYRSLAAASTAAPTAGANIWVRDGSYAGPVFVKAGTSIFGGFAAGFALASRNAQSVNTIVTAGSLQPAIDVNHTSLTGDRVVLDGLFCRGNNTGFYGVDTQHADIDMRSLTITGFTDRGIRMRHLGIGTTPPNEIANAQLVHCTVQQNGADGLSVLGAYNLRIDHCSFDANVQEGIDLGPLFAINGFTTTFQVTASRCANNGAEGLDASLAQPIGVSAGSATFDVHIENSTFDGNGLDGLLVDQEHELATGWRGHIVIRECSASNNALAGVHVDADAPGDFLLHRVRATANGADGILVSSELAGGPVVVSSSYLAGNLGAGLNTSLGNKRILASHCVFAGNQDGGFLGTNVECAATNCIAHLQPNPFQNVRQLGSPIVTDAAAAVFGNAPNAYARVNSHSNGTLGLAATAAFSAGATVELADDGTAHQAAQVTGTTVVLGATPTLRRVPTMLMAYASSSIAEDTRLAASSVVAGQAMSEQGAGTVDPGPYGSLGGGAPGFADPLRTGVAWLDQVTPTPPATLGNTQPVALRFSRAVALPSDSVTPAVDQASVSNTRVRVINAAGNNVAGVISFSANTMTINPPGGGWPAGALRLELHRGITAGGTPVQPVIVPLR